MYNPGQAGIKVTVSGNRSGNDLFMPVGDNRPYWLSYDSITGFCIAALGKLCRGELYSVYSVEVPRLLINLTS